VVFESTVSGGDFTIRGTANVEDLSTGPAIIRDLTINAIAEETRKMTSNKAVVAGDDLSVTVYENDELTVFKEFDISADKRTRTPR
jgi:hypothetical protein